MLKSVDFKLDRFLLETGTVYVELDRRYRNVWRKPKDETLPKPLTIDSFCNGVLEILDDEREVNETKYMFRHYMRIVKVYTD